MDFLSWHYSEGFRFYIQRWLYTFDWIVHYFSLTVLLKTLFAPWKRLVVVDKSQGFNPSRFFQELSFNLISRGIGAVVRVSLFGAGLILIAVAFLAGIFGLLIWVVVPPLSLPVYLKYNNRPEAFIERLIFAMRVNSSPLIQLLFENEAGEFVLSHVGLELSDLVANGKADIQMLAQSQPRSYQELLALFVKKLAWTEEFLKQRGTSSYELLLAAYWWDKRRFEETLIEPDTRFGRPGIGLELLFGYTPTLNQFSTDLSLPQSYSHRLIGREQVVSQMERALTAGTSVVLMGDPGVGKKTIVLEFAHRGASGGLGKTMAHRRVLEFDYNALLSETTDLNLKKTKLVQILQEGASAGNIILVVRDIHRLTNSQVEGYDFTDAITQVLEKGELKVVAITTPEDYERFIASNFRLRKFFEKVEASAPTKDEALIILLDSAARWESLKKQLTITIPALRQILEGSDKYISDIPFPEKALELLDSAVIYKEQKGGGSITVPDIDVILEERTGIPSATLTQPEKERLGNLEEIMHERLVNQEDAVSFIAKSLRARSVVSREDSPLGSFLFLGPTGVGKTETAKVLARVYYGSMEKILRFDMAEYAGDEGLERLIGSSEKNQPGMLTTEIKNRPASLLLLDEIEKAPPQVFNLFLSLLDEGQMTDALGNKVNGRHLFIVATSNAGSEYVREQVGQGVTGEVLQRQVVEYVLQHALFTPEFLNRFDGVVVYEPLKSEHLVKIAQLLLSELAENLKEKNVYLEVTPQLAQKVASDGYDPAFGARPMQRIIDLVLGDVIGKAMLQGQIGSGDKIHIVPGAGKEEYHWEKITQ